MHWTAIASYLAANWLEVAGVVTTVVGIWLTTRRKLICWPVVLISDVLYLIVFYRVRLVFRCAAADLLSRFHALRMVVLVARRARRRRGARGSAADARACLRDWRRARRAACCWAADGAHWRGAASSGCDADQLQPCGKLVAGAQAHC